MEMIREKRVYSNGIWSVIERIFENGESVFSVVRFGSSFYERTFRKLTEAIDFCDQNL